MPSGAFNRSHLKRLERASRKEMVSIPQRDGTVKRFPKSALKDACLNALALLCAGDEPDLPVHPLVEAARNSSDEWWANSLYAAEVGEAGGPAKDLSEA